MKTSKDKDWLLVGFGDIIEIKKIITEILENYKCYWNTEVPEWDYEIREAEITRNMYKDSFEHIIEIWCGLAVKVCITRKTTMVEKLDFAQTSHSQLYNWKQILIDIGTTGINTNYQDTIKLYRTESIESNGVPYGENPLSITEAHELKKQSK